MIEGLFCIAGFCFLYKVGVSISPACLPFECNFSAFLIYFFYLSKINK